jgi:hypothetical protein
VLFTVGIPEHQSFKLLTYSIFMVFLENDIRAVLNILSMNCKYADDWDYILDHAMREKHYWILLSTSFYLRSIFLQGNYFLSDNLK